MIKNYYLKYVKFFIIYYYMKKKPKQKPRNPKTSKQKPRNQREKQSKKKKLNLENKLGYKVKIRKRQKH